MAAASPREPSFVAVGAGQLTLLAWLCLLLLNDLDAAAAPGPLGRAASPLGAAVLGVLGFAVPVIFGMFPRLAPGLLGLPRPSRREAVLPSAVGAGLCACALAWVATGADAAIVLQGALGAAGGALLLLTVAALRARRGAELKIAATAKFAAISRPGNLLLGAGLLYLVVGCVLLALVAGSPGLLAPPGSSATVVFPLHLLTAGFIVLTVFGVGSRMFGAFSGAEAPPRAVWFIAGAGIPAPALLAAGLYNASAGLIAAGGLLALCAALTFSAVVIRMWSLHRRRRRLAWLLLMAGSLALLGGETLGVLFALVPSTRLLTAVHGQVNTLGFAGLMIFGVLFELSGGRAARPDVLSPGVLIAFVWPAALLARAAGTWWGSGPLAAAGDLALLTGLLAAALDAHPSGPHPLPPKPAP